MPSIPESYVSKDLQHVKTGADKQRVLIQQAKGSARWYDGQRLEHIRLGIKLISNIYTHGKTYGQSFLAGK